MLGTGQEPIPMEAAQKDGKDVSIMSCYPKRALR